MKSFSTPKREVQPIPFDIDGEEFLFTPPKRAELVMSVVDASILDRAHSDADSLKDLLNWLGDGLPEEQRNRILERLQDPKDDFDLPQVNEISRYLISQTSGRPTKRRSG